MQEQYKLAQLMQSVERNGVAVEKEKHGFAIKGMEMVFPYLILTICLRGSARASYDLQEITFNVHDLAIIMPGHILHPISCSDDYTYVRLAVSSEMVRELPAHIFSHDYKKFNHAPICHLTGEQVKRLMAVTEVIYAIASHDPLDLQLRRQMLLAQLAVGYEFINYYRREQDRQYQTDTHTELYLRFCDLVVTHYKENRNVNYYADLLGYEPRYFSKVFRQMSNGISPLEWIGRYVATQAKRIMDTHPNQTVKEVAFQLGFPTTGNFCRYFKRVTGIYPQEYKNNRSV